MYLLCVYSYACFLSTFTTDGLERVGVLAQRIKSCSSEELVDQGRRAEEVLQDSDVRFFLDYYKNDNCLPPT